MKSSVTKDPFETAAAIFPRILANTDKDVNRITVSRHLNEFSFATQSSATNPLISKASKKARLEYAEAHVVWRD